MIREERVRLLQFVTGCPRVPVQGFKALKSYEGNSRKFNIHSIQKYVSTTSFLAEILFDYQFIKSYGLPYFITILSIYILCGYNMGCILVWINEHWCGRNQFILVPTRASISWTCPYTPSKVRWKLIWASLWTWNLRPLTSISCSYFDHPFLSSLQQKCTIIEFLLPL